MRTAAITLALLCGTAMADDGIWRPSDNGNLLWQKEQQNQIRLVPSRVSPVMPGTSLYTDSDTGASGRISKVGEGQYLLTEDGANGGSLTIVREQPDGGITWTKK